MIQIEDQILPYLNKLEPLDFCVLLIINRYMSTEPFEVLLPKLVELIGKEESLYFTLIKLQEMNIWKILDIEKKNLQVLNKKVIKKHAEQGIFIIDSFSNRSLLIRISEEKSFTSSKDNNKNSEKGNQCDFSIDCILDISNIQSSKDYNSISDLSAFEEVKNRSCSLSTGLSPQVLINKLINLYEDALYKSSIALAEHYLTTRHNYDQRLTSTPDDKTWNIRWARHLLLKFPRIPILTFQNSIKYFFSDPFWAPKFNSLQFLGIHIQEYLVKDKKTGKKSNLKIIQ